MPAASTRVPRNRPQLPLRRRPIQPGRLCRVNLPNCQRPEPALSAACHREGRVKASQDLMSLSATGSASTCGCVASIYPCHKIISVVKNKTRVRFAMPATPWPAGLCADALGAAHFGPATINLGGGASVLDCLCWSLVFGLWSWVCPSAVYFPLFYTTAGLGCFASQRTSLISHPDWVVLPRGWLGLDRLQAPACVAPCVLPRPWLATEFFRLTPRDRQKPRVSPVCANLYTPCAGGRHSAVALGSRSFFGTADTRHPCVLSRG